MLDPKYQRYAERIRDLIEEGERVATFGDEMNGYIRNPVMLNSWWVKVLNIIEAVFGPNGVHRRFLDDFKRNHKDTIGYEYEVNQIVGLLKGGLDDLEKGFLVGQEFIVAGEVFDSVLQQAKYLNQCGYKDPAAILARTVIEDTLKRLAKQHGLPDSQKASKLNDDLKQVNHYPQAQWRLIQAWLDIGNAAAHGNFSEYTQQNVTDLLEGIELFLATYLR